MTNRARPSLKQVSGANIEFTGGAMPFPAQVDNGGLDAALGVVKYRSLKDGIAQTLSEFRDAKARGFDTSGLLARLTEVS